VLLAGTNPVAIDATCARLIGFDPARLPIIARAFEPHAFPLIEGSERDVAPASNAAAWNRALTGWRLEDSLRFHPHFAGWARSNGRMKSARAGRHCRCAAAVLP